MKNRLYQELRDAGRRPVVHPNGFIQLELDDHSSDGMGYPRRRLHIWPTTPLNKQQSDHPVHDHRFDMVSEVLVGCLINRTYMWVEKVGGTHQLYKAEYKHRWDTNLVPSGKLGFVRCDGTQVVAAGGSYALPAKVLHSSDPLGFTVTIMTSTKGYREQPVHVAVPVGTRVDNDFKRDTSNSPSVVWRHIRSACVKIEQAHPNFSFFNLAKQQSAM